MECIILVGGLGTRLRSTVPDKPKPLAPIHNKPFLSYLISYWKKQGIKKFILAAGYKAEQIEDYISKAWSKEDISISIEETPLGTGGGLIKASSLLSQQAPFLLINGDTLFPIELNRIASAQSQNDADIIITLSQKDNIENRYTKVSYDEKNKVVSFKKNQNGEIWTNAGTYIIHPRLIDLWSNTKLPSSLENELLPQLCLNTNHRIFAEPAQKINFIDIGTPEDYNKFQDNFNKD